MSELFLNATFRTLWENGDPFAEAFRLEGRNFRLVKARRTFRFELAGQGYFAKLHRGIGWREILKDLLQFKQPVLGAANEYRAIRHLEKIGVETMTPCAYGVRGLNPARRQSFLITAELADMISLEDYCRDWNVNPPPYAVKASLTAALGERLGAMHRSGLNHRDCYLCHFLLDPLSAFPHPKLHVIDLHRSQIREQTPYRYLVKDVAGLYFSAMDAGLTQRDLLRFIRNYEARPLPRIFPADRKFWRDVTRAARKLYRKIHGQEPPPIR